MSGDGARVYYGYKADADYSKERLLIKVTYYKTKADALKGGNDGVDPLGKFVRVEYTSNNPEDANQQPDKWALRPTWWFGVPNGLKADTISQIRLVRNERGTQEASSPATPGAKKLKDASRQGYVVASDHTYNSIDQWKHSVSRDYYSGSDKTIDGKGWQRMVGITKNEKDYDNSGNTKGQWDIYKDGNANGLQGIFADWESAGQRYYEMSYVAEMTDDAWKQRDQKPLLFVAGIYRGVGKWRYAAGTTMRAPKIADNLELKYPKPTPVKDLSSLDENEQKAVKKAIEDVNKSADTKNPNLFDKLVAKDGISVDAKGNATITFTDNTKRIMPANLLVLKNETDKDKYKPTLPARTPVVKLKNLTTKEKTAVTQAIINANGGSEPNAFLQNVKKTNNQYEIRVQEDGSAKVTYADGSELTIPSTDLVYQGATIADWAPYRVPVPTEVDDPSKALTEKQKTAIASAFDEANKSFPVYQAAKKHNHNTSPVTFDNKNNAVITWEDGSQTTIPAWQFLKKQQTQSSKPEQKQTTKEFTVDLPATPVEVTFDPFDKTATVDQNQLTNLETALKDLTAKDASDSNKTVTLTSAKISIADGTVTFKADGYEDRKYPIGIFYKKKSTGTGTQNPTPQTPTSKTDIDPDEAKNTFTYNVRKIEIDGDKPTAQDAIKALKQFVRDNYDNVSDSDLQNVTSDVAVAANWKPKANTKNMGSYLASGDNAGPMSSFSIVGNDFGIQVIGHPWSDDDNGGDWSSERSTTLFTIKSSDLYVKKGTQQNPTDNTVEKLRELAKQLLNEKKSLTKSDFTRAGLNKDEITDKAIDKMTDAEELRELIKKLSEAKHADPTYNSAGDVVVDNPATPTEDDFKKAVEAFVKVNYDNSDKFNANTVPTTLPTDLTPKSGTVNMEIADDNIKSVTSSKTGDADDYKSMVFKDQNGKQLFAVAISYKKKEETPKLSDDELKEMRKQAKETIDRNPNLTKKDKEGFDTRIDKATNAEDIQKILKEAAEKANQNSTSNDPKIKGEISGNQNGTDAENQQKLDAAKEAAKKAIDALTHLSEPEKKEFKDKLNGENVKTPADVQKIVDAAKLADELKGVKEEAQKATFVFLDHGTGDDKHNTADTHTEDAALNELLHGTPAKDPTLAALEAALAKQDATAEEIKNALDAAKLQNTSNEQNAKNAGIAKLEAKKAELDAAYNALTDEQKKSAKDKYEAATKAINDAKTAVNKATKPSEIKKDIDGVDTSLNAAKEDIKNNTPKRDTSSITNDQNSELAKEKKAAHDRVNKTNLSPEEKKQYNDAIDASTRLGDPTGIANRAEKHQKIEDAKKQIADLKHLNKAQKQYYENLLDSTDASDHVDEAGKSTGKDDIDDALEQALNLNGVMKRLADLATSADKLKKDNKDQKYSSATEDKKSAFDAALKAANTQLDKVDGADSDNINADGANALYNDLLKAMQGLDSSVKGVDLYTEDLRKEYTDDVALKEKPVYKNATKNVKEAFDAAVTAAKAALENATKNPTALGADAAAQQNAIGAALANLVNTRKALDGIDTTALQAEVDKDKLLTDKPVYKNASGNKKTAFDKALAAAEDAIADAEGKKQLAADEDPKTQEQKQKAVNDALTALQNAAKALDGKEQKPTPAPSVDKTGLKALVDAAEQVKDSDAYKYANTDKQGAYDKAISDGQNVLAKTDATADDVANAVQAITTAKTALDGKKPAPTPAPSVDKSGLQHEIANSGDVKKSDDYTNAPSDKKQAYDHALDHANEVNKDPNATQDQVNQAAEDLKKAEHDLKPAPSPIPSPLPTPGAGTGAGTGNTGSGDTGTGNTGSGSEAGHGVNDNAPTTVDKGELNIQIDSAESDLQPGNAGNGNTGSNNAGNAGAGNANAGSAPNAQGGAGAQGAGAGAGTGTTGAANAGVDNKAVNNAVENSPEVKQADAAVKQAAAMLDEALTQAKSVAADPHATQAQVDAAAVKLADARKAFADAQANAAKVRAAVRSRVIKGMRSRGNAGIATGANVATTGLMATMIAAIGGAFVTRRMRAKHANRD
ncbi:hypothetical protein ACJV45_05160 [Gardnerella sp. Marseille-Q9181]|uniref:hypothetical protein n=1 Tax=Gardnerella sp. Marseille-Q9181 TaxID=3383029 RepID=UPI003AF4CFF4